MSWRLFENKLISVSHYIEHTINASTLLKVLNYMTQYRLFDKQITYVFIDSAKWRQTPVL